MHNFNFYYDESDETMKLVDKRVNQMMEARKNFNGIEIEKIWRFADLDMRLHGYGGVMYDITTDDYLRDLVKVRRYDNDYRSDSVSAKSYTKVQTAIGLLFDRNPESYPTLPLKRMESVALLAAAKLDDSHAREKFKEKLKVFMFDACKYGTGFGRTFIKVKKRKITLISENDKGEKKKDVQWVESKKEHFEQLSPWNVWIDENTKPSELYETMNDWCYYKPMSDADVKAEYGKGKAVTEAMANKQGRDVEQVMDNHTTSNMGDRDDVNRLLIYENYYEDMQVHTLNGYKIKETSLPNHKKLSCVMVVYNIRDGVCPYGVGIPEMMRQSKLNYDRFKNANQDVAAWASTASFLIADGDNSQEKDISLSPGEGKRNMNADKVEFYKPPSVDPASIQREQMLAEDMDDDTGITKSLTGATSIAPNIPASYLNMAKDAALQRLRPVLDNLLIALEYEAELRWSLIRDLGISELSVKKVLDKDTADKFFNEHREYMELYGREDLYINDEVPDYDTFNAPYEISEDGTLEKTSEPKEYLLTQNVLDYDDGFIFKSEAVLVRNRELDKQLKLEMFKTIMPFLPGQKEIYEKPVRQIIKIYGEDPNDILPDTWLTNAPSQPMMQPAPTADGMPQPPRVQNNPIPEGGPSAIDRETRREFPRDTRPEVINETV